MKPMLLQTRHSSSPATRSGRYPLGAAAVPYAQGLDVAANYNSQAYAINPPKGRCPFRLERWFPMEDSIHAGYFRTAPCRQPSYADDHAGWCKSHHELYRSYQGRE